MDWLAGLSSWLATAERTEMHRNTEQTQTCHFRSFIQSVMIFPHLARSLLPLFMAHHAPLHFGYSAFSFFLNQCAPPTDLCNREKGRKSKPSWTTKSLLYILDNVVNTLQNKTMINNQTIIWTINVSYKNIHISIFLQCHDIEMPVNIKYDKKVSYYYKSAESAVASMSLFLLAYSVLCASKRCSMSFLHTIHWSMFKMLV